MPLRYYHYFNILYGIINSFITRVVPALISFVAITATTTYLPCDPQHPSNSSWLFWLVLSLSYASRVIYSFVFDNIINEHRVINRLRENQIFNLALSGSILLMALLPSYASIGIYSTLCFAGLVVVQGICYACEFPRIFIHTINSVPASWSSTVASILSLTTTFALYAANLIASKLAMRNALWLVGCLGVLLVLLKYLISDYVTMFNSSQVTDHESKGNEVYKYRTYQGKNLAKIWSFIKIHAMDILLLILPLMIFNENYALMNGKWWREHLLHNKVPRFRVTAAFGQAIIFSGMVKLFSGPLADIFGLRRIIYSALIFGIIATPLNYYFSTNSLLTLGLSVGSVSSAIFATLFINFIYKNMLAPVRVKHLGMMWQITSCIFHTGLDFIPSLLCYTFRGGLSAALIFSLCINTLAFVCLLYHQYIKGNHEMG